MLQNRAHYANELDKRHQASAIIETHLFAPVRRMYRVSPPSLEEAIQLASPMLCFHIACPEAVKTVYPRFGRELYSIVFKLLVSSLITPKQIGKSFSDSDAVYEVFAQNTINSEAPNAYTKVDIQIL